MDTHDETLGWKQRAIKEHILHQEALDKVSQLSVAHEKSKQLLKKTAEYNKYFEQKFYALEKKYAAQETKLHNTIAILKTAQQLIKQRKFEGEQQSKKHVQAQDSLLTQIDLLSAKNALLKSNNTQLQQELIIMRESHKQQLQLAAEALTKEKALHSETNNKLSLALNELEKAKDQESVQAQKINLYKKELSRFNGENLEEFFVYKVLDGAKHEVQEDLKTTRQR
jgi:hypothetical protein